MNKLYRRTDLVDVHLLVVGSTPSATNSSIDLCFAMVRVAAPGVVGQSAGIKLHEIAALSVYFDGCGPVDIHPLVFNGLFHFADLVGIFYLCVYTLLDTLDCIFRSHHKLV